MATNLTYQTLFDDIAAYFDRGGSSTDTKAYEQIPRLINQAERIIATDAQLQGYERTLSRTLTNGVSVYAKPDRWKETISVTIAISGSRRVLSCRAYEYCRAFWPDESQTGVPLFYAEHGPTHWLVSPTPAATYGAEIKVYQMPALLDATNSTNWLTEEAPQLLLNCSLREVAAFLKNESAYALFDGRYKEALGSFMGRDMKKMMDRAAERDGV
jgi:hypothetical protein